MTTANTAAMHNKTSNSAKTIAFQQDLRLFWLNCCYVWLSCFFLADLLLVCLNCCFFLIPGGKEVNLQRRSWSSDVGTDSIRFREASVNMDFKKAKWNFTNLEAELKSNSRNQACWELSKRTWTGNFDSNCLNSHLHSKLAEASNSSANRTASRHSETCICLKH